MIEIISAIIAEFNPLHKGHEKLIRSIKKNNDSVVVILSSNFTQRGSPAFIDKFMRARTALMSGADLVVELPFLFACSAGIDFARGAVSVIERMGGINNIAFGMENPEFDVIKLIEAEKTKKYQEIIKIELHNGSSFIKAHALSLDKIINGSYEFISKPNNMLAVSYIRELVNKNLPINIIKIKREGNYQSKLIRENMSGNSEMMPDYSREIVYEAYRYGRISDENKLWPLLQNIFIRSSAKDLRKIYGIDEGIENLFLRNWRNAEGIEDFVGRCVCARYTRGHIRRRLIYILMGLDRFDVIGAIRGGVPYIRVLGFNERGREILHEHSGIKVITKLSNINERIGKFFAQTEQKASQLFELTLNHQDFKNESQMPVIYNSRVNP